MQQNINLKTKQDFANTYFDKINEKEFSRIINIDLDNIYKKYQIYMNKVNNFTLKLQKIFMNIKPKKIIINRFYDPISIALTNVCKNLKIPIALIQRGRSLGADAEFINLNIFREMEPDEYILIDEEEKIF